MKLKSTAAPAPAKTDSEAFGELEDLFGQQANDLDAAEKVVLSRDLEGFAHCFPDWDLHPPVKRKTGN